MYSASYKKARTVIWAGSEGLKNKGTFTDHNQTNLVSKVYTCVWSLVYTQSYDPKNFPSVKTVAGTVYFRVTQILSEKYTFFFLVLNKNMSSHVLLQCAATLMTKWILQLD